jgi:aspartyl/asparaginyl-tRNA synthetase
MHQLAEAELNELRAQLEQERQARQEAVERAESLERELALLKEQNEQQCLRLSGELDQERQATQKAEAEVASIHAAILEQIAKSEAEEAINKAAEQEKEQRLQEQIQGLQTSWNWRSGAEPKSRQN